MDSSTTQEILPNFKSNVEALGIPASNSGFGGLIVAWEKFIARGDKRARFAAIPRSLHCHHELVDQ